MSLLLESIPRPPRAPLRAEDIVRAAHDPRSTRSLRVLDDLVVRFIAQAPRCQRMEIVQSLDLPETYVRRALPRLRAQGRIVGEGVRAAMRYMVSEGRRRPG